MPQWVMRSEPSALSLVPVMLTPTGFTTVPVRAVNALSAMLNVKSDGTGGSMLCPRRASDLNDSIFGCPPVVMATLSKAICLTDRFLVGPLATVKSSSSVESGCGTMSVRQ